MTVRGKRSNQQLICIYSTINVRVSRTSGAQRSLMWKLEESFEFMRGEKRTGAMNFWKWFVIWYGASSLHFYSTFVTHIFYVPNNWPASMWGGYTHMKGLALENGVFRYLELRMKSKSYSTFPNLKNFVSNFWPFSSSSYIFSHFSQLKSVFD